MRKIITFVLAIAMVMACAVSASAESKINLTGDHAGDKEGPGYAEYEVLGLDYDAGAKINEDGLVVEAGFEVHAIQGTAEGKLGSEENNVHGGVTGSLGGGRAGAGISAGLDEKGNVKVGAELGAEAIGAEVGVEGGVTVGGIEANVGAKGKVGVGAKAKAGFEDGKLKLELELVVGLGGEVDVEIDLNNLLNQERELDLHGPAVTGPESENVSRIGEVQNTYSDGIHTTFATYGTVEPDWHGPAHPRIPGYNYDSEGHILFGPGHAPAPANR